MSTKSILVIEDNLDIRSLLVELLNMEGHPTVEASNGAVALNYLHNNPQPDLVLLDMMMPVMNGREFLDALKLEPKNSNIPVIVMSAIADNVDTSGAQETLKKPLNLDTLLNLVSKYAH
ncbi:MAG: response regulator [Bdellovibrionales bacterium]|nr:response regulator [Bdellovibrionales bacterium]